MVHIFTKTYNSWPWKPAAGQKLLALQLKIWKSLLQLGECPPPLLTRPQWKTPEVKKQAVTVSHSKSLYQFVASVEAYPYAKDQYHSSIKSWYVADLILRITFGRPRYAWPHPYKWTESNRCIFVRLTTCKKSTWYLSLF